MCYFQRTFSEINKPEELEQKCLELCKCLADDLAHKNLKVSYELQLTTVLYIHLHYTHGNNKQLSLCYLVNNALS